jgi:hypothetical protein
MTFADFLASHWHRVDAAFYVFHLQPINPNFCCVVIRVVAATNRKGNADVVEKLLGLKRSLESRYTLDVISLAFDGFLFRWAALTHVR